MNNRKQIGLLILFFFFVATHGFAQGKNTKEKKIPYQIAQRYFVKNTVEEGAFVLSNISSQELFEQYFGMATIMGKNGRPTPIDFSKQYVIAIIDEARNATVDIHVERFTGSQEKMTLVYEKKKTASDLSASFRACLLLVVDKKYSGDLQLIDKSESIPYVVARNYFVKNTLEDTTVLTVKITSEEEFDRYFGRAPLSTETGQPTAVDFTKQFVLAVIDRPRNHINHMQVDEIIRNEGKIKLIYSNTGQQTTGSATFRSCLLVVIDNAYETAVEFELR